MSRNKQPPKSVNQLAGNNKMPVFQFSSVKDKEYSEELKKAIQILGGKCDDSRVSKI